MDVAKFYLTNVIEPLEKKIKEIELKQCNLKNRDMALERELEIFEQFLFSSYEKFGILLKDKNIA